MLSLLVCAAAAAVVAAEGLRDAPMGADAVVYLDGSLWTATSSSGDSIGCTVPGDLITDLAIAGRTRPTWLDLTWRDNATLWDEQTWTYATSFSSPPAAAPGVEQWLVFDGIKLAADISLNGVSLGAATDSFIRYTFPITSILASGSNLNNLTITFPPTVSDARNDNGRYMGCSGGWDWSAYSAEATGRTPKGIRTLSKGVWKSIYVASVATSALTNVKTQVFYTGAYPTAPLTDASAGPWRVDVTAYLSSPNGASGSLTVVGAWAPGSPNSMQVTVPAGAVETAFNLSLTVPVGGVQLWWPNTLSSQRPMYALNVTFTPSSGPAGARVITSSRSIAFRTVALVTADDSNPAALQGVPGSGNLTMRLKVNGADMSTRGANWIPAEQVEGRGTAAGVWASVRSAAEAGMNMMRIWGGGGWPYDAMLDACDFYGIILYHDMAYASQADSHHFPTPGPVEEQEMRYQLRRISPHPSIVLYDAGNECGGSGAFQDFVSPVMASEDASRPVWPCSPSSGWADGVDRLWGMPMPNRTLSIIVQPEPVGPATGCNCTAQANTRYFGLPLTPFNSPVPASTIADCCNMCTNTSGCEVALFTAQGCQLLAPPYAPVYGPGYTALFVPGAPAPPPVPLPNSIEQHGPYQGGGGWPTVNGAGFPPHAYDPELPPSLQPTLTKYGGTVRGSFTSEFGVGQPASFENMSPTLDPTFWSMHGGNHPADNCTGGFAHVCTGGNVMAQRNYGCDDAWVTYFPAGSPLAITLDDVGAAPFAGQLYLCQLVTAIKLKSVVEWHRSENIWGLLTWQLGEVWPTMGWGSLEYSSGTGSVTGGRWKPSHYMLRATFADVFGACGQDGRCYVKNDNPLVGFTGTVTLALVKIATGAATQLLSQPVTLSAGANAFQWMCADGAAVPPAACNSLATLLPKYGCAASGADCLLLTTVVNSTGATVVRNPQLLAVPGALSLPTPAATVTTTVASQPNADGSINVTVTATGAALYVTLFTQANGRFSDNVLYLQAAGSTVVQFIPFAPGQMDTLTATLRVDHLQKYFTTA